MWAASLSRMSCSVLLKFLKFVPCSRIRQVMGSYLVWDWPRGSLAWNISEAILRSGERIKRFQMKTINMELERETPPWILVEFGQPMEAAKHSALWQSHVVRRQVQMSRVKNIGSKRFQRMRTFLTMDSIGEIRWYAFEKVTMYVQWRSCIESCCSHSLSTNHRVFDAPSDGFSNSWSFFQIWQSLVEKEAYEVMPCMPAGAWYWQHQKRWYNPHCYKGQPVSPARCIGFLYGWNLKHTVSGDNWMYPYQRTPMGNPYTSSI